MDQCPQTTNLDHYSMGQAFSLCRGARQQSPHPPNTPTTPTDTTVRYSYPQEIGGQQAGYVDQELLRSHLDFTFPLDQFPINGPSGDRFQIRVRTVFKLLGDVSLSNSFRSA